MDNMIYDRYTKTVSPEKIYKSAGMHFYYKTTFGGLVRCIVRLPAISMMYGFFQKSRRSKRKIAQFISDYNIDVSEFDAEYRSFNDFFIRKNRKVTFDNDSASLIAPAESCVLAQKIERGAIYTVKDRVYTLSKFLKDEMLANEYEGGYCLIFRLRVYDYHRFCFPDDGTIILQKRIRGLLDSINTKVTGKFTLSSNYRVINCFRTKNFGDMIFSEVGAMLVGQIVQTHKVSDFCKGDEKGYFEFGGSTIVVLVKKDIVKIDGDIIDHSSKGIETKVNFGERIGVRI